MVCRAYSHWFSGSFSRQPFHSLILYIRCTLTLAVHDIYSCLRLTFFVNPRHLSGRGPPTSSETHLAHDSARSHFSLCRPKYLIGNYPVERKGESLWRPHACVTGFRTWSTVLLRRKLGVASPLGLPLFFLEEGAFCHLSRKPDSTRISSYAF